jgi:conjugative transfer protein CagX
MMRLLAAFLAWLPVIAAPAVELKGFSFDYQITGDRSIAPFQVFDDGVSTYLQFRDPAKVPAIFVRNSQGSKMVTPEPQGNYLRIAAVAERLELVSERKTAAIVSTRKTPPEPPGTVKRPEPQSAPSSSPPPQRPSEVIDLRTQVEALRAAVEMLSVRMNATPTPNSLVVPVAMPSAAKESAPVQRSISQSSTSATAQGEEGKGPLVFEVEAGQRLSEALRRYLATQRLDLDWDTGGADFEIRYGFRVVAATLEEVLLAVLRPFKLSAVTHRGNRVVAVSRAA